MEKFTVTQLERLNELNGDPNTAEMEFADSVERDQAFRKLEKELVRRSRGAIRDLLSDRHMTKSAEVGQMLEQWLMDQGYTKVMTPTIITKEMLAKMTIEDVYKRQDRSNVQDGAGQCFCRRKRKPGRS